MHLPRLALPSYLIFCAACGSTAPKAVATPPPPPSTHEADCKSLVATLDEIERNKPAAAEDTRGDLALRAAMKSADAGATQLEALHPADETARRIGGEYAVHLRKKHALMTSLLPALERFSVAVEAVQKIEVESEPQLEPCKQQKKLSKACQATLKSVVDRTTEASMEAATAQADLRALLADPAAKDLDERLGAKDRELADQLHDQCGGPRPGVAQ